MARHALTDKQWKLLQPLVSKPRNGPATLRGDRAFVDAVLYRIKTGVPWRDLPERFGPWKTVYNRFNNWARKGTWDEIFLALQVEVDEQYLIIDGSVVRAHQHSSGGKGGSKPPRERPIAFVLIPLFLRCCVDVHEPQSHR